jgi:hypothetical protein
VGKTIDRFTMPSGRKLTPLVILPVIDIEAGKNIFIISQYQVIQKSINKILVKIVKGRDFDPNIVLRVKRGIEEVFYRIDEDVDVEINVVNSIPKESSGKRREIISLI